ncbi:DUF3558 domain-containing protein [Mycobacterium deserti]|uniref:DUF3558 domain-containing protein n=1 Tax=Mycobacterium deserti TaxID=2978347 RepID=A0ABT2MHT6_9MYCO|nr:DUF3558 domain-containing protein [Mycobacterium deserti]MCT7661832.1 DUF3558 domain-containing protein [Mycobacterium deserti]
MFKQTDRGVGRVLMIAAACFALTACGAGSGGDSVAVSRPAGTAVASDASGTATEIDACALVSAEDIATMLGVHVEGKSTTSDPRLPGCIWENPSSYESISVEIGSSNTAVNNTLPPPEPGFPELGTPGPDGMRFLGNGVVEFVAGSRLNMVQVAVLSMAGDEADTAAVELARKIGPQIPQ